MASPTTFSGSGARRSSCLPGTLVACAMATLLIAGVGTARSSRDNSVPLVELATIELVSTPPSDRIDQPTPPELVEEAWQPIDKFVSGPAMRWYNGRPIRAVGLCRMIVTAYSPDERSCGEFADGITASGFSVYTNGMKLVAADTSILPFGSLISVPGYDESRVVPVLDRGGRIKGDRLDVLYPTHEEALEWGVQELDVVIWEYVDDTTTVERSSGRNFRRFRFNDFESAMHQLVPSGRYDADSRR